MHNLPPFSMDTPGQSLPFYTPLPMLILLALCSIISADATAIDPSESIEMQTARSESRGHAAPTVLECVPIAGLPNRRPTIAALDGMARQLLLKGDYKLAMQVAAQIEALSDGHTHTARHLLIAHLMLPASIILSALASLVYRPAFWRHVRRT